jgi:hypothetical protein
MRILYNVISYQDLNTNLLHKTGVDVEVEMGFYKL